MRCELELSKNCPIDTLYMRADPADQLIDALDRRSPLGRVVCGKDNVRIYYRVSSVDPGKPRTTEGRFTPVEGRLPQRRRNRSGVAKKPVDVDVAEQER